jgi:hypothetical protein
MSLAKRWLGLNIAYVLVGSGSNRVRNESRLEPPAGYEVRNIRPEELYAHIGTVPDLSTAFVREIAARKDSCVASFHEGSLVGFSFQTSSLAEVTDQLEILIPKGFHYTYKTWTHEAHRRKGLSRIQGSIRTHGKAPSNDRGIWYVETHNYPSLMSGYRHPRDRPLRMGFIGWIRLWGRDYPFVSRTAAWLGLELVRRDRTCEASASRNRAWI